MCSNLSLFLCSDFASQLTENCHSNHSKSFKIIQLGIIVSNGAALFIDLIEILNDDWCLELNALATACLPHRSVCFRAIYDLPNSLLTGDG